MLIAGPATATITNAADARRLAARERSIAWGIHGGRTDVEVLQYSDEWYRVYTADPQSNNSSFLDMSFGPTGQSNNHVWGGTIGESAGSVQEPGLAQGDIIVWTAPDGTSTIREFSSPADAHVGALRWYSGVDLSGEPLPLDVPEGSLGVIYRHKFACSLMAQYNDRLLQGTPEQRDAAFKKIIPFKVLSVADGSMVIQGIGGQRAADGDRIHLHAWSEEDCISLAGVEGGEDGVENAYGLILTGATFSVSGQEVTITKADTDFRPLLYRQGQLLTNGPIA